MIKTPTKEFTITLQDNSYTTNLTQGKIIDFELNKATLSQGLYQNIKDVQVLDMIDCTSALLAFFPDIKEDLKVKSVLDLSPVEAKEMAKSLDPFFKWYVEWKKYMSEIEKEEELKDEDGE